MLQGRFVGTTHSPPHLAALLVRTLLFDSTVVSAEQRYRLNTTATDPLLTPLLSRPMKNRLEDCSFVSQGRQCDNPLIEEVFALIKTTIYYISSYHESRRLHREHSFMYVRQKKKRT